jgi:mxaJ protein
MSAARIRLASVGVAVAAIALLVATSHATSRPALRVCADPNNLPYSNARGEGFENEIAKVLARELGRPVEYTWWAQRRGFFRNTLNAGLCDIVIGVPTSIEMVRRTKPYYRSSYVFVTRRDRGLDLRSLDDSVLRALRIGVPMVGDDYTATPPAAAMIKRGLAANLVSFSVYGDYSQPNPPARLVDAVRSGQVDVAIAWGPLAGYFGRADDPALVITPVTPQIDLPFLPMTFDIAMGVRREDSTFAVQLDSILDRRRGTGSR